MRFRYLLTGLWVLAGCRASSQRAVASAGARSLSADRLARLMVLAQPLPLSTDVASELASHWVTLMAFGQRMAAGDSLLDSATIADLLRYRVRQALTAQWRRHLLGRVPPAEAAHFDSSYARELLEQRRAQLDPTATTTLRELAANPWRPVDSTRRLATFVGGAVAADQVQGYVQYLSPATRLDMRAAPDDRVASFLWGLVLDELLLAQAESAGVRLDQATYHTMTLEVREAVRTLWERTGLWPSALSAAGGTTAERQDAAARKVEAYLEAAAARKVPLQAVPAFLAVPLLRSIEWEIAVDRMDAVVDRARRLLAATEKPPTH